MMRFWRNKPGQNKSAGVQQQGHDSSKQERRLPTKVAEVREDLKRTFHECSDLVVRDIIVEGKLGGCLCFIDGMVDGESIQEHVLASLLHREDASDATALGSEAISASQVTLVETYRKALDAILAGQAVLFIEGRTEASILVVKGGARRSVEEPQTEAAVRGPREGFTENLRTNTALVRFKVKTPKLKLENFIIGEKTQTSVALAYIEGVADSKVLEQVRKRLKSIEIDAILESGYIEEMIEDNPYSPFPQVQYTERPDTAAAQLLEGKFAIFIDGTPFVLTAPVTAWSLMQASEDYYERYIIANLIRWLRIVFMLVALFTPALYVAVTTYHQDMLPTTLMLSIAAAREAIPFPAIIEALIMEISFEALREAGIRLPKTIGQAVSILGALVIGQAAVQAGIVSAPMVIIVSLTGIASFTIPRFNFAISIRMLRFPLMFLAALFGLFGIVIGVSMIAIHLCKLKSFGVPYLSGIAPLKRDEVKDILFRAPWWKMRQRPSTYAEGDLDRVKPREGSTQP